MQDVIIISPFYSYLINCPLFVSLYTIMYSMYFAYMYMCLRIIFTHMFKFITIIFRPKLPPPPIKKKYHAKLSLLGNQLYWD